MLHAPFSMASTAAAIPRRSLKAAERAFPTNISTIMPTENRSALQRRGEDIMTASIARIRMLLATVLAVGALLAPAGVALARGHHHRHYCDDGGSSNGRAKCDPAGGPGGLGKVHGPGSSHNPIIVPSPQPTVTVRDHRGQPADRSSTAPQRTSQTCTRTNRRGCIVDHRTRTGSRIRWQPPGPYYGPPHYPHPTPKQRSCLEGHWSDCAPGQIRNHKPVPCLGNLC